MLTIAICDDDDFYPKHMELIIQGVLMKVGENVIIDKLSSGEQLLDLIIRQGKAYNIVFMDIEMPGIDGIETVDKIRKVDDSVKIVFVSGNASNAIRGYGKGATDFIDKLDLSWKLEAAIINILEELNYFELIEREHKFKQSITIENKKTGLVGRTHPQVVAREKDIIQLQKEIDRFVTLKTTHGDYRLLKDSLNIYLKNIDSENFIKVRRSHLINMHNIKSYKGGVITLINDETISLIFGDLGKYKFEDAYNKFREGRAR